MMTSLQNITIWVLMAPDVNGIKNFDEDDQVAKQKEQCLWPWFKTLAILQSLAILHVTYKIIN